MNEMITNPLGINPKQNAIAAIESNKAIAEVHAAMSIARSNQRNEVHAMDKIINACTRQSLAETAVYSYARGGTEISGPSIRLAETIAQNWGNIQFGFNELSRGVDYDNVVYSEVGAYAWDLETNTRRPIQFRVRHWRDTKKGGYALKDERDIYELIANNAQRRVRACILAIIPGDVVEAAVNQCEVTLNSKADVTPDGIKKMIGSFQEKFGVTKQQIEKFIQRRADTMQPAQAVRLRKIYTSLKDNMSSPSDWFEEINVVEIEDPINQTINKQKQSENKAKDKDKGITNWLSEIEQTGSVDDLKELIKTMPEDVQFEYSSIITAQMQMLVSLG